EEAFAGVGPRHEVGMLVRVVDLEDRHRAAGAIGVALLAGQPVIVMTGRRSVAAVGVEKAEHLVKRPVFQHQLHDVFNGSKMVRHFSPLFPISSCSTLVGAGNDKMAPPLAVVAALVTNRLFSRHYCSL